MSMLMSLSLTLSTIFIMLNHPLSMGLTLLMQTLFMTVISGYINLSFWFSYIMFMIMIGGMLVLFIYMTSIASNEKFKFSMTITTLSILTTLASTTNWLEKFFPTMKINNIDSMTTLTTSKLSMSMTKYFMNLSIPLMLMVIIFLLITLIAVVKITNVNYGALRQKF
uniref:NADH-ubiquinone oxidoreductase chain 6 n=3 Tax=Anthrenus TaxID=219452 RepID=A0A343C232_9COLE